MKILVPLDGSETAEGSLSAAAALANIPGTTTVLVAILPQGEAKTTWSRDTSGDRAREWTDPVGTATVQKSATPAPLENKTQAEERLAQQAREYLGGVAKKYFRAGAKIDVEFGDDVADNLIRVARAEKPDFIVMATHGRSALARMVMGSVTDKVMRSRIAPLVLTRPNHLVGPER